MIKFLTFEKVGVNSHKLSNFLPKRFYRGFLVERNRPLIDHRDAVTPITLKIKEQKKTKNCLEFTIACQFHHQNHKYNT